MSFSLLIGVFCILQVFQEEESYESLLYVKEYHTGSTLINDFDEINFWISLN